MTVTDISRRQLGKEEGTGINAKSPSKVHIFWSSTFISQIEDIHTYMAI
jgi:hypothetical protein